MLIGVVGKANVGKSTFFKAATLAEVDIANYPFTTIEKNEGVGFVKIECAGREFKVECKPKFGYCLNNKRFVPVHMIDVAGLVPGAHLGKGRGNQFLDDLRQADVLIHIVDISGSTNENGGPVPALSYDPAEDIKFLEEEIDMWFFGILKKPWERFSRQLQQEGKKIEKEVAKQFSGLKITEEIVKEAIRSLNLEQDPTKWSEKELKNFATFLRKKSKPMIIAANKIDVPGAAKNLEKVKKEFQDYIIVPCSAESELALKEAAKHHLIEYVPGSRDFKIAEEKELSDRQKNALSFIKKGILEQHGSTGVQEVLNKAVFELLGYIAVFPVATNKLADKDGNILPDCFLVPQNTTTQDFAFKIHTDIGADFIKAIDLKTKQIIGKEAHLKNLDVVEIVTKK